MNRDPLIRLPDNRRSAAGTLARRVALVCVLLSAACVDLTGPDTGRPTVTPIAGDAQFGLPGALLEDLLYVEVKNAVSGELLDGIIVQWRIVQGAGAQIVTSDAQTDLLGVSTAQLRLGPDTGVVRVEATVNGMLGVPATFRARSVRAPVVESLQPGTVAGGANLTITGQNFSTVAAENTVLFGGRRGYVNSATATSLSVTVPNCVTTRTLDLRVHLGTVASAARPIQTVLSGGTPLTLQRGQARVLTDPADLGCLFLPAAPIGTAFLLVNLNGAAPGLSMPFEFIGLAGGGSPITTPPVAPRRDAASEWEMQLRLREREFLQEPDGLIRPQAQIASLPEIGERTQFKVLNRQRTTDRITAEVRAISERAIVYLDLQAPANGFTQDDLVRLGQMFDDPIYPTDVAAYGSPSDIDANSKIVILLTPRVNALTPPDDEGFIAGYFYGCDLVLPTRCEDTNRAEIFYSLVPDPLGQFGAARSKATVMRTVPGVLAHEFQHMIHFGQKGRLDALWLSEGLAHQAEDLVADVFAARGEITTANEFRAANYSRAATYLATSAITSLVSEESPGTLGQRGGNWLFVKYLMGHYGGTGLLGRLVRSNSTGMANVTTETGRTWNELLAEFAVSLWATGAPELQGLTVDPHFIFLGLNLRTQINSGQGFPLRPEVLTYTDFTRQGELPPGAVDYRLLQVQNTNAPAAYNVSFAGRRGGPFLGTGVPIMAVLRVR
jgi:hypothetical protein